MTFNHDTQVLKDARKMLEKSARLVESLEHADTGTSIGQRQADSKLSEAIANIHAALARLEY